MRSARVFVHGTEAAVLTETEPEKRYTLTYVEGYDGPPVSLTIPVRNEPYSYTRFPAFFEGLLPEGPQLQGLLRVAKIEAADVFGQLLAVGGDVVGAITVTGDEG